MSAGAVPPEPSSGKLHPCLNSAHTKPQDDPSGASMMGLATCTVWAGGELVELRLCPEGKYGAPAVGGGKRGQVATVQSFASRRRMGQFLGKLRSDAVPAFVTLTIPDTCCPAPKGNPASEDQAAVMGLADIMAALQKRFKRQWPDGALIWKREHHASCVPHFHMLVWLNTGKTLAWEVLLLQRWMRPVWSELLGVKSRVEADAARDCKTVKHYASGYLWRGKGYQLDAQGVHWGDWWGKWNPSGLPFGEPVVVQGSESMYWGTVRAAGRAGYRGKRPRANQPTARLLAKGDNMEWARLAVNAGGTHQPSQVTPVGGSRRVRVGVAGAVAPSITAVGSTVQTQGI